MLFWKANLLSDGKVKNTFLWDILLFVRRTFLIGEGVSIPTDKVLQMHSPFMSGELYLDGEAYIL
jgi:hypothetical protein